MRLIDADALEDSLGIEDEDINFKHILIDAPTIDPHKHGHWIYAKEYGRNGKTIIFCSVCGEIDIHSKAIRIPYCWYCGAKMDKNIKEDE